ncbi:MAG: branched-chain amino acid ABC transporter permease [Thaumarchaeota archaeon]|nr:branched-chain amino acid ABC transporter permease [Nitrososphaerota archaeon]
MEANLYYLVSALVYGTFFALMAMGLTLTYMTTKVPNFAYGSFVTIGLYTAYQMHYLNHIGPYGASVVAFAVTGVASLLMYVGIIRPLARRGTPLVAQMIATFGVDIAFIGIFGIYTDYMRARYGLNDTKSFFAFPDDFTLFGLQGVVFVAPIVLALITISIYLLFTRTKFGIAMRASVENSALARILGINVELVYGASWVLAGGLAGVAGAIYTLWLPGGTSTGSDLIVEIFASSILGGLTSIFGAVAGGLVIGGSETLVTTGLALGIGIPGTIALALVSVAGGVVLARRKGRRPRVMGALFGAIGAYMFVEMATGFSTDFFVRGLANGFGAGIIPFQKGIPLLIMVIALLVLPKGLTSIKLRRRGRGSQ